MSFVARWSKPASGQLGLRAGFKNADWRVLVPATEQGVVVPAFRGRDRRHLFRRRERGARKI